MKVNPYLSNKQAITSEGAAQKRAATIIYQEAARLSRLVEDLLDLARIDSGQVVMQKTPLDLGQILSSTFERLLPQAAGKKVNLIKNWGQLPLVVGDGDRLAQVFTKKLLMPTVAIFRWRALSI